MRVMRALRASFSLAIAAAIALTSTAASAVPSELSFAGRLSTSAGPVDGTVSIRFAIFDVATGGTAVWSEDHPTIAADAGLVLAQLGTATTLDSTVFDGGRRWLEITVGSETLAPRLALGTVPYAFHAATADSLGDLGPGDVQARVTGACPPDSSIRAIDPLGNVTCEPDDDSTYAGAAPITVTGGAIGLAACADGQIYKRAGGAWACAADIDTNTTYSVSPPLSLAGTTLGLTSCPVGEVIKSAGSAWTCGSDNDTQYTGTLPLLVSGTTIGLNTCPLGQILKSTGVSWSCATETTTTYSVSGPLTLSGTTLGFTTCPTGFYFTYGASGWGCTAVTGIAPVTVSSGAIGLQTAGCTSGQVYKLIGGMWTCANDNDTDTSYSAGTGLGLAGTTFSVDGSVVARKDVAAGNQSFDSGTLYLDYANNRVGVGITSPTQALDVSGNARAVDFRYQSPATQTYVVPHVEFQNWDLTNFAPVRRSTDHLSVIGFSVPVSATLDAALHLPAGASTTQLACDFFDNSSNNLGYTITSYHRDQSQTVAVAQATSASNTTGPSLSITSIAIPWTTTIVANDTYFIRVTLTQQVTSDPDLRFYGCRVNYTVAGPS